jgi:hypothetical protein
MIAPLAHGLPNGLAARVGRLVLRWAQIEFYLLRVEKRLAGFSIAQARTDWHRRPAWPASLASIEKRAADRGFSLDAAALATLRLQLDSTERIRHLFVHAPWRTDRLTYSIYATRREPNKKPREVQLTNAYLTDARKRASECLAALRVLDRQTEALL